MQVITKPKTLNVETFDLNGEAVSRVVMEINGYEVQVLAYGKSPSLTVLVDNGIAEQVHLLLLDEFLARVCQVVTR